MVKGSAGLSTVPLHSDFRWVRVGGRNLEPRMNTNKHECDGGI